MEGAGSIWLVSSTNGNSVDVFCTVTNVRTKPIANAGPPCKTFCLNINLLFWGTSNKSQNLIVATYFLGKTIVHICMHVSKRRWKAQENTCKTWERICFVNSSKLFGLLNCAQLTLQAHDLCPTGFPTSIRLAGTCILKIGDLFFFSSPNFTLEAISPLLGWIMAPL